MEYYAVFVLLVVIGPCSGLEVLLQGEPKRVEKPGAPMNLTCVVDDGLPVILSHTIQWVHSPLVGTPKETILTNQQTLTDNASPDQFMIDVTYNDSYCTFTLVVKEVKPFNDGIFNCKVTRNADKSVMQKQVQVTVVNNVQTIAMQFDGEGSITGEDDVVIQREEGQYGVTCTAGGFSPEEAALRIFVGDEEQETGGTEISLDPQASERVGARRYRAAVTAPSVSLRAEHSGARLRCVAQAYFDGATAMVASVPLFVIVLEPVVKCNDSVSAKLGDRYVKIDCHVEHHNVPIDRYSWEIGKTGEMIMPGQLNDNYNEVTVETIDQDNTKVILDLYEVTDVHFDTYFYLDVFTASGQRFRTKATLIKDESNPSNSSTKTSAMLWVSLVSVVLSLVNWC